MVVIVCNTLFQSTKGSCVSNLRKPIIQFICFTRFIVCYTALHISHHVAGGFYGFSALESIVIKLFLYLYVIYMSLAVFVINALLNLFYNVWLIVRIQLNVLFQPNSHINIICDCFTDLINFHTMKRHGCF